VKSHQTSKGNWAIDGGVIRGFHWEIHPPKVFGVMLFYCSFVSLVMSGFSSLYLLGCIVFFLLLMIGRSPVAFQKKKRSHKASKQINWCKQIEDRTRHYLFKNSYGVVKLTIMSNLKYQTTTSTPNYRIRFNNLRMNHTERLINDWVITLRYG
jgi:hypothetical protein